MFIQLMNFHQINDAYILDSAIASHVGVFRRARSPAMKDELPYPHCHISIPYLRLNCLKILPFIALHTDQLIQFMAVNLVPHSNPEPF